MGRGHFRIVQQWGAGLGGVDLEAGREKGISVANVPANGANAESVAEHGILLALALLRDLPTAQINVRKGILGSPTGKMLAGRTVCLFGTRSDSTSSCTKTEGLQGALNWRYR